MVLSQAISHSYIKLNSSMQYKCTCSINSFSCTADSPFLPFAKINHFQFLPFLFRKKKQIRYQVHGDISFLKIYSFSLFYILCKASQQLILHRGIIFIAEAISGTHLWMSEGVLYGNGLHHV